MVRVTYEVRRGAAIVTERPDEASALAFASVHSHDPGQLKVFLVKREDFEITEAPAVAPAPRKLQAVSR